MKEDEYMVRATVEEARLSEDSEYGGYGVFLEVELPEKLFS